MFEPEIIDIGGSKESVISFGDNSKKSGSVNFGGGIELLMNEKRKDTGSKNPSTDIDLGDINELENELNELDFTEKTASSGVSKSSMFKYFI